jgi:hypothetical protein
MIRSEASCLREQGQAVEVEVGFQAAAELSFPAPGRPAARVATTFVSQNSLITSVSANSLYLQREGVDVELTQEVAPK